ncbi:MAG: hypothetical protein KJO79_06975 [Verrucomicrobiae bacterium]|nr:hypothetical protein [Verrucomicrobiae bacterium]NNJ86903.1 hypothetical protein [Akkermansiaceae bacterium]
MPESKTIEIDEIVTPEKSAGDDSSSRSSSRTSSGENAPGSGASPFPSDTPFADFQKALPWKARLTLKLTQWFMILRSKSWGKLVIVPAVVLGLLLAIPLGMIFFCILIIRSFLKSLTR